MIRSLGALVPSVAPSSDLTPAFNAVDYPQTPPQPRLVAVKAVKLLISITLLSFAIALVALKFDTFGVFAGIHQLSILTMSSILVALLLNVLAAALRLKIIANDIGSPFNFRQAMAAVSGGGLAGAAFFQFAGQLMARGVIMGRSGVPFASVAVMTAYERIIAAVVSGLLALAGAYFIFGRVIIDRYSGGDQLIKIAGGLIAAIIAGALLGHGRMTARAIAPFMKQHVAARVLSIVGLSLLVQLPMMAAYVAAAHAVSPQTPIAEIAAASAIVMFAASVPISLAGWGVREMSAVIALGTIGIGADKALGAAIVIGAGSILAMATVAAISMHGSISENQTKISVGGLIDFARALAWTLPLAAATLVLFQIYIPMPSGTLLNVNLADPIAILAASFFLLKTIRSGHLPQWRFVPMNAAVAAATLVFAASLIIGATAFGWTEWALVNRFLGWFVLLAFAMTGALIIKQGGEPALRMFLLTFAGATAAVAAIEIGLSMLTEFGFALPVVPRGTQGFAQNHNFFAFELLMAISATAVAARGATLRVALLAILIAGLWFCGSRSAWITLPFVLGTSIYMRTCGVREIAIATLYAAAVAVLAIVLAMLTGAEGLPVVLPSEANTAERLFSIFGGLRLFVNHPMFGAGLGAFRNQMIFISSDQPLLIHSTVVWLLAEMGIVGFLIFSIPAVGLLSSEIRCAHPDISSKLIVVSLVAFGLMSAPADMLYQRTFWLLIGAALALMKSSQGHDQMKPAA